MSNLGTFTRTNVNGSIGLTLPNTGQDGQSGINVQYNIYENRFYDFSDPFYHYKTNIPFSGWSMHNIEAVGHSYGSGLPIRCNWCFHVSYGNGFYQIELTQIYGGLAANRLYNSGDGFVVLVANGAPYFSGWSFNAYSLNPTGPFDVQILAMARSNSNSNIF